MAATTNDVNVNSWNDLLLAAESLIASRDDGMLTQAEWDALETAANACREGTRPQEEPSSRN